MDPLFSSYSGKSPDSKRQWCLVGSQGQDNEWNIFKI